MKVIKKAETSAKSYKKNITRQTNMSCTDFHCKHCILTPGPNGCHCT